MSADLAGRSWLWGETDQVRTGQGSHVPLLVIAGVRADRRQRTKL
jgi:hypothetical protein